MNWTLIHTDPYSHSYIKQRTSHFETNLIRADKLVDIFSIPLAQMSAWSSYAACCKSDLVRNSPTWTINSHHRRVSLVLPCGFSKKNQVNCNIMFLMPHIIFYVIIDIKSWHVSNAHGMNWNNLPKFEDGGNHCHTLTSFPRRKSDSHAFPYNHILCFNFYHCQFNQLYQ